MVQCHHWLYSPFEKGIDNSTIVFQFLFIPFSSFGFYPTPLYRKSMDLVSELLRKVKVCFISVVVITGNARVSSIYDIAWNLLPFAPIIMGAALTLVCRGCSTPHKASWKLEFLECHDSHLVGVKVGITISLGQEMVREAGFEPTNFYKSGYLIPVTPDFNEDLKSAAFDLSWQLPHVAAPTIRAYLL
jgi:hypothetical protein